MYISMAISGSAAVLLSYDHVQRATIRYDEVRRVIINDLAIDYTKLNIELTLQSWSNCKLTNKHTEHIPTPPKLP